MTIQNKICLGIESTAHTFGVGIMDESGNVLANSKDIYKPKQGYGIHPTEAAEHHRNVSESVLKNALETAKTQMNDIDFIAFSCGPGLPPCLKAGMEFTKKLSLEWKKPIVPVSHIISHVEIGKLATGAKDPVVLYVSGGNTQVIAFAEGRYRVFGESEDIAIGNAQDSFCREVGLEFPGGPKLDELAKSGKWVGLPYVVKGMDLSFTGIVTEALKKYKNGEPLENIAFSMNETMYAMLTEVSERALAHTEKNELLLTGGVAASKRLQEMLAIMCAERSAKFSVVPHEFAGDNGAMIAWAGILQK
ncbi:MAG: KEOPS complex N(6)-L-threonylcarbamoyladenine synthase Kae1, partial [Candidatus Aenigmatarchaeota archaeon]